MSKSAVFIDVSGLFRAHWHSSEGQEIGEAFSRTVAQVHRLRQGHDFCAVCCDAPPYRRKAISAEYKSKRDAPPPQLVEQLKRTKDRLIADGLLLWESPGYEADDVIAWATRCAVAEELAVTVVSGDKDLLQLVNDAAGVKVYSPISQKSYDEAAVREKFAVPPGQIRDLLALTGDSSDNVPGVPGVGPKTAAKMLADFHTLENLLANTDKVPGKAGESLRASVEAVKLAKRLITLETDVPLDFDALYAERAAKPLGPANEWDEASILEKKPVEEPRQEPIQPTQSTEPLTTDPVPEQEAHRPIVIREPHQVTQLALRPAEWAIALEPTSSRDAYIMAKYLHNSRLFGNLPNPDAVFAIVLRGRSLGLDAVTSLSNFHIIDGRPTMHAALIIGLVHRSGKAKYFQLTKSTADEAAWKTHRIGDPEPVEISFSVEDALAAGLLERHNGGIRGVSKSGRASNWDKYRRTMLRWRAGVELARAVYPDVTTGLYTPDEMSDGTAEGVES